jgi:hypothetical protein
MFNTLWMYEAKERRQLELLTHTLVVTGLNGVGAEKDLFLISVEAINCIDRCSYIEKQDCCAVHNNQASHSAERKRQDSKKRESRFGKNKLRHGLLTPMRNVMLTLFFGT